MHITLQIASMEKQGMLLAAMCLMSQPKHVRDVLFDTGGVAPTATAQQ